MRALQLLFIGSISIFAGLGTVACGDSGSSSNSGGAGPGAGGASTSTGPGSGGATTTTTTASMMTSSTTSGPLMCASPVTNIPTGECDMFLQDCPNSNQTCTFVDNNGTTETACMLANGLKTIGQACVNQGECAAGLFCIGDPGTCTPACCPDTDEPCMGGSCNLTVNVTGGMGQTDLEFSACSFSESCTLFVPDSCLPGEDCHLSGPGFAVCDQPSPTPKAEGEMCVYVNDCGDSQSCVGNMTDGYVCRYLCEAGSSAAPGLGGCPATQTCDLSFDTGFNNIGLCHP